MQLLNAIIEESSAKVWPISNKASKPVANLDHALICVADADFVWFLGLIVSVGVVGTGEMGQVSPCSVDV